MNYGALISRSWKWASEQRSLWFPGMLAVFTEGGIGFGWPGPWRNGGASSSVPSDELANRAPSLGGLDKQDPNVLLSHFLSWVERNMAPIAILSVVSLALILALWYVSLVAKASLIVGVDRLEAGQTPGRFDEIWRRGRAHIGHLSGLYGMLLCVSLAIMALVGLTVWGEVTAYHRTHESGQVIASSLLAGLLLLLAFVAVGVYFSITLNFTIRAMVLRSLPTREALAYGHGLLKRQWRHLLTVWAVALLLGIGSGIAVSMGIAVIGIGFALIGAVAFFALQALSIVAAWVAAGVMVVLFLGACWMAGGIITVFFSSYYTLSFRAVDYIDRQ